MSDEAIGRMNNIVLFMTDQWRWDTLNDPGHPAKLPHLHAFKAEATNYLNAFSPVPLCTPARGSLFTGLLPHQHGAMDNVQGNSFYPYGKLHPVRETYLERLMQAGYEMSFIGKWHLGRGTLLDRHLTDVALSDGGVGQLGSAKPELETTGPSMAPYYETISAGTPLDGERVEAALARLRRLAGSDRPFCLIISLHGPHFPHLVPKEFVDLYNDLPQDFVPTNFCPQFSETGKPLAQDSHYWPCQDTRGMTTEDWRRTAQHYWGFCSYLDHLFGQVRRTMHDCDLDQSTVLAFTSDHGEMLGAHGWFDKGPFFYDEVMRIPMLLRDPKAPVASEAENFVSLRDLFPTLLDLAGATPVLNAAEQARSYLTSDAQHVTFSYDAYQGRVFLFRGIRGARYKYAWSPHDIEELYDLETDPQERQNRATDPALFDVRDDMKAKLFKWMEDERDYLRADAWHLPVGSYVDGRDRSEQHEHLASRG